MFQSVGLFVDGAGWPKGGGGAFDVSDPAIGETQFRTPAASITETLEGGIEAIHHQTRANRAVRKALP